MLSSSGLENRWVGRVCQRLLGNFDKAQCLSSLLTMSIMITMMIITMTILRMTIIMMTIMRTTREPVAFFCYFSSFELMTRDKKEST